MGASSWVSQTCSCGMCCLVKMVLAELPLAVVRGVSGSTFLGERIIHAGYAKQQNWQLRTVPPLHLSVGGCSRLPPERSHFGLSR